MAVDRQWLLVRTDQPCTAATGPGAASALGGVQACHQTCSSRSPGPKLCEQGVCVLLAIRSAPLPHHMSMLAPEDTCQVWLPRACTL